MATYVLFCIYSNTTQDDIRLALAPPFRRYLWEDEFAKLKVQDIKEGKGWVYDADPFARRKEDDHE